MKNLLNREDSLKELENVIDKCISGLSNKLTPEMSINIKEVMMIIMNHSFIAGEICGNMSGKQDAISLLNHYLNPKANMDALG